VKPINPTDWNEKPKNWRSGMTSFLILLGVVIAWLLLTQWILPKMGVPT
jgi:hypothetical protein